MAALILPSRRVVQPQGPVEIDWANPITRGLFAASSGRGSTFGFSGLAAVPRSVRASGHVSQAPGSVGYDLPLARSLTGGEWTIFSRLSHAADFSFTAAFGIYGTGQNRITQMYRVYNSGNFGVDARPYRSDFNTGVSLALNREYVCVTVVSTARETLEQYIDGVLVASTAIDDPWASITVSSVELFTKEDGFDNALSGSTVGEFGAFSRALSPSEAAALSRNPWQLFKPIQRRIWVETAAVGGATHAAPGALANSGGATAGAAARTRAHPATGTLANPGGSVVGAASSATPRASSGVLANAGAATAGAAARTRAHPANGILANPGGVASGAAARTRAHPASGTLANPGATTAGAASSATTRSTSGVLAGAGAQVSGSADHITPGGTHATTGALVGAGAQTAGAAAKFRAFSSTGTLSNPGGAAAGAAARQSPAVSHATEGVLTGPGAGIVGSAQAGEVALPSTGGGARYVKPAPLRPRKLFDDDEPESVVTPTPAPKPPISLTKQAGIKPKKVSQLKDLRTLEPPVITTPTRPRLTPMMAALMDDD